MKKLIIILGVLGVSFSSILVKYAAAPSPVLAFYRVLLAAVLLLPVVCVRHRAEYRSCHRTDLLLCVVSGVALGAHFSLYFEALDYTSVASALVLVDTEVFFVAIAMLLIARERVSLWGWVGIAIAFLGSIVVSLGDMGGGSDVLRGDLYAVLGAVTMAVYTICGRSCRRNLSTTAYTFLVYLSAAAALLVLNLCSGTPLLGYGGSSLLIGLALAVVCTLLGHSVFSWGLKYEKASFISMVKLLEPVFATVLALVFFRELPPATAVAGGVIVIGGITLYSLSAEARTKSK